MDSENDVIWAVREKPLLAGESEALQIGVGRDGLCASRVFNLRLCGFRILEFVEYAAHDRLK